jgi:hypothetical protein
MLQVLDNSYFAIASDFVHGTRLAASLSEAKKAFSFPDDQQEEQGR